MPKRRFVCETCGATDLPKNKYYKEHYKAACLRAAVAAVHHASAPDPARGTAPENAMAAHEGGAQEASQVLHDDQHFEALDLPHDNDYPSQSAHEPAGSRAAGQEPAVDNDVGEASINESATAEQHFQHLEALLDDADAFVAACQHAAPAEGTEPSPAASDHALPHQTAVAALADDLEVGACQQHHLTEEAAEPVERDDSDAEHVYAAPEDQQFQGERPGDAQADQSALRPGTAAYYDAHRHDDLYAGAQLTVEQTCYLVLSQKQAHRQHDTAFDEQCRLQRDVMLPKPNKMPGSLYLMRKVHKKSLLVLCRLCWLPRECAGATCCMHVPISLLGINVEPGWGSPRLADDAN